MKRGQVLVEVIIAMMLAAVGLAAAVNMSTRSTSNTGTAKRQSLAMTHAGDGMEWVRSQRVNLGWRAFTQLDGAYCLTELVWRHEVCGATEGTDVDGVRFVREAVVSGDYNQKKVDVTVEWDEGGKIQSFKQSTVFTQQLGSGYNIPTPTAVPTVTPVATATPTAAPPTATPTPLPPMSWKPVGTYTVGCGSETYLYVGARQMRFQMQSGGGGDGQISLYCLGSSGANWTTSDGGVYAVTNQSCPLTIGEWRQTVDFGSILNVIKQSFRVGCNDGETMVAYVERYGY